MFLSQCSTTRWSFRLAVVVSFLIIPTADAIAPRYVPDEELAAQPIIVVGHWEKKSGIWGHNHVEGNICLDMESRAELVVERVISGDIKPGAHTILLGPFIGWDAKDGGRVMSFTSTELEGDVGNVAESNLWFLKPKRSWDKTDTKTYVALTTYRGVQPLMLEAYFCALSSKKPGDEVVKLLASDKPLVIERALAFLSGGTLSWPYGPSFLDEEVQDIKRHGKPLVQFAPQVEELLSRTAPEVRRQATAVYAEMAGKDAIHRLRFLLRDPDADVRAIAAGALISQDDRASGEDIVRALVGRPNASVACQLIERLKSWKSNDAVPALIEFLQDDESAGQIGDDIYMPAIQSRIALKLLTEYDFPTDVSASRSAWRKVESLATAKERTALLARILANDPAPLVGRLALDGKKPALVVTNRSKKAIVVLRQPTSIDYLWPGAISSKHWDQPTKRSDFVELSPGATASMPLELDDPSTLTSMKIAFLRNGNEFGLNAWIGVLDLNFEKK